MKDKQKTETENYYPNITKDDLTALGDKDGNLKTELSDDTILKNRTRDVDFTGKNLDIPGRTLQSQQTNKTLKDEENQLYSQGSDSNEDLEQTTEHIK